jgi:hypothetical protein
MISKGLNLCPEGCPTCFFFVFFMFTILNAHARRRKKILLFSALFCLPQVLWIYPWGRNSNLGWFLKLKTYFWPRCDLRSICDFDLQSWWRDESRINYYNWNYLILCIQEYIKIIKWLSQYRVSHSHFLQTILNQPNVQQDQQQKSTGNHLGECVLWIFL